MGKYFLILFVFVSNGLFAQNISGVWRGVFYERKIKGIKKQRNEKESKYNFEVQIIQDNKGQLKGVTYTFKTKEFYGKASFRGKINQKKKSIHLFESKILDSKTSSSNDICMMDCLLSYKKKNGRYYLMGSFVSKNALRKMVCSSGDIILEKVSLSLFNKELLFFEKNENSIIKKNSNTSPNLKIDNKNSRDTTLILSKAKTNMVLEDSTGQKINTLGKSQKLVYDKLLRQTEVLKTINVYGQDVLIEYYDNGITDNDSISVFENEKLIYHKVRVSTIPIVLKLKMDSLNNRKEVITIAENLGEIPPNTTLMVITIETDRYEIPINTDDRKNVKVIFEYSGNKKNKISVTRGLK